MFRKLLAVSVFLVVVCDGQAVFGQMCRADFNEDGAVNFFDFLGFSADFGRTVNTRPSPCAYQVPDSLNVRLCHEGDCWMNVTVPVPTTSSASASGMYRETVSVNQDSLVIPEEATNRINQLTADLVRARDTIQSLRGQPPQQSYCQGETAQQWRKELLEIRQDIIAYYLLAASPLLGECDSQMPVSADLIEKETMMRNIIEGSVGWSRWNCVYRLPYFIGEAEFCGIQ